MPVLDGKRLLKKIITTKYLQDLPVVLYATLLPRNLEEIMALGAADFVLKPGSFEEWCSGLDRIFHRIFFSFTHK